MQWIGVTNVLSTGSKFPWNDKTLWMNIDHTLNQSLWDHQERGYRKIIEGTHYGVLWPMCIQKDRVSHSKWACLYKTCRISG